MTPEQRAWARIVIEAWDDFLATHDDIAGRRADFPAMSDTYRRKMMKWRKDTNQMTIISHAKTAQEFRGEIIEYLEQRIEFEKPLTTLKVDQKISDARKVMLRNLVAFLEEVTFHRGR